MNDKRQSILRILNEFRVARNDYLHDGRQVVFDAEGYITRIEALFTPSLLQQVMEASKSYVERFGGTLDEDGTLMKFGEEVSEFYEASTQDTTIRNDYEASACKRHMAEEAVDVMVTMGGVMAYYGLTFADIESAAHEKLKKLTDRTTDDYTWHEESKTVIKRSKLAVKP